jgi:hypothetical protein
LIRLEPSESNHFPKAHQLATKSPINEPVGDISYSDHNTYVKIIKYSVIKITQKKLNSSLGTFVKLNGSFKHILLKNDNLTDYI